MQNDSNSPLRVEKYQSSTLSGFVVLYLALFGSSLLIGKFAGPQAFIEHDTDVHVNLLPAKNDSQIETQTAEVLINRMVPKFQLLYVFMELEKPGWDDHTTNGETLIFEQELSVDVHAFDPHSKALADRKVHSQPHKRTITCRAHQQFCDRTRVFYNHFIDHHQYMVKIQLKHAGPMYKCQKNVEYTGHFAIVYVSREYTEFEIGWKYAFLGVVLLFNFLPRCGYFPLLFKKSRSQWTSQQRWVAGLLLLLILFNDPFFLASIFAPPNSRAAFVSVHIVGAVTFLSVLLNFWLKVLQDTKESLTSTPQGMGRMASGRDLNWVPRTLLCLCFFASTLSVYFYEFMSQFEDPAYSSVEDMGKYTWVWVIAAFATAVYCFWALFLFYSCMTNIGRMQKPFVFVFFLTAFTMIVAVVGVYIGCLSWIEHSSVMFLGFSTIFNLYILTLGFVFSPSSRDIEYSRQGDRLDGETRIEFSGNKGMPGTPSDDVQLASREHTV
jgi:hypothetical protein